MSATSNKDNELWRWAEKYADLKKRWREVVEELGMSQDTKAMERLKMERRILEARIDAIKRRRRRLVDELVNNKEERPHRSEVEEDPVLQAKRQEEFSN